MKDTLQQWWRERSQRERVMVAGTVFFVLASMLFFLVWQPINQERLRLQKRVPEQRAVLQEMLAQAQEAGRLQSLPPPSSLEAALKETGAESGVPDLKGAYSSDGPGRMRLTINAIEFNRWLAWMGKLQKERAVRLESAQVEALPESGMVKVNALLASATGK